MVAPSTAEFRAGSMVSGSEDRQTGRTAMLPAGALGVSVPVLGVSVLVPGVLVSVLGVLVSVLPQAARLRTITSTRRIARNFFMLVFFLS